MPRLPSRLFVLPRTILFADSVSASAYATASSLPVFFRPATSLMPAASSIPTTSRAFSQFSSLSQTRPTPSPFSALSTLSSLRPIIPFTASASRPAALQVRGIAYGTMYQPSQRKRKRKHGFLARRKGGKLGQAILARRRMKGRRFLSH